VRGCFPFSFQSVKPLFQGAIGWFPLQVAAKLTDAGCEHLPIRGV
jgi:hypothetical protein